MRSTVEIRDLHLFLAVVDSGSITAGARRCSMSLSAASARIAALERHFGLTLLDRGRRGITPAEAATAMIPLARRIVAAGDELEALMAGHGGDAPIRLGVNSSAADALVEFLAATLRRLPTMNISLHELDSDTARDQVVDRSIDLAVVSPTDHAESWDRVQARHLWDDRLVVIGVDRDHPGDRIGLDALFATPLIGLLAPAPLQAQVDRAARAAGIEPAYRMRLPSLGAVCALASTGAAHAVVPAAAARRHHVPPSTVRALDAPWAQRTARVIARDFAALEATTAAFCALLEAYGRDEVMDP